MWQVLLWVLGIGTIACSVFFVVLIAKRKNMSDKTVKAVKYILIALVPLVWGIGIVIAGKNEAGRDKAASLAMLILLLAAVAAFLGDIKKDLS